MLTISNGLIFADPAMTTLIGIMPGLEQSQVTIPSSVKAITGYQAAVVYDTTNGNIINPSFTPGKGLTIEQSQQLLDLGSVGAFQQVGKITPGAPAGGAAGRAAAAEATKPSMTDAVGLSTLTSINFANGSQLQTIGPKAFAGCSNLTSVSLPDSCNTIGAQAFQNCTSLQSINLKGVQYIGDAAFNNAFIASNNAIAVANPVSLNLSSAQYIGTGAFDSSKWTATTTGSTTTNPIQVLPGTNGANETPHLSKISTVTFGNKLNTLNQYAFNGANYLTSADLSGCTSLAQVSDNAFRNTSNLTSVKFSNTIDTIGNSAFSGAPLTGSLSFNTNGDLNINQSAFDTQALTSVDFSQVKGNITIGQSAFSGSQFDTIDFSKVTSNLSIGQSAFSNNTALKTITWAKGSDNASLTGYVTIGDNAFSGATSLKLAPSETDPNWMPSNLIYVGNNAFAETAGNTNQAYNNPLQIPADKQIGNAGLPVSPTHDLLGSFAGTALLGANSNIVGRGTLTIPGTTAHYSSISKENTLATNTIFLGPQLFQDNTSITSVDLSGSNIQALGFGLQNGAGATSISNVYGTFKGATNLTDITLPATCSQFGMTTSYFSSAFANCTSLNNINYKNFKLNTTATDGGTAPTGFNALDVNTWTQVANIMNAFAFFGQTTIGTDGTVSADPTAANGNWASTNTNIGLNGAFGQVGLLTWGPRSGNNNYFNYPINAYPSGSYQYNTTAAQAEQPAPSNRATTNPVTVSYAAGLGMAVDATTGVSGGNGNNGTGTLATPQVSEDAQAPTDYLTITSSTLNDNTAIQVPTTVGSESISASDTINISGTRPQSVWYTVGTSQPTNPTNNIYVPNANKLVGTANSTAVNGGGSTWTSTAVANSDNNTSTIVLAPQQPATPPAENGGDGQTTTTQNFYTLPLGITADTTVAYFNHNGVVWKYTNNDGNIKIEGWVNGYIGGEIQSQANGVGGLALSTNTSNNKPAIETLKTQNGVYNGGAGLTSVGSVNGSTVSNGTVSSNNIGGVVNGEVLSMNNTRKNGSNLNSAYVCLFGSKVTTDNVSANDQQYSATVAPKAIKVTLTLTTNGQ